MLKVQVLEIAVIWLDDTNPETIYVAPDQSIIRYKYPYVCLFFYKKVFFQIPLVLLRLDSSNESLECMFQPEMSKTIHLNVSISWYPAINAMKDN